MRRGIGQRALVRVLRGRGRSFIGVGESGRVGMGLGTGLGMGLGAMGGWMPMSWGMTVGMIRGIRLLGLIRMGWRWGLMVMRRRGRRGRVIPIRGRVGNCRRCLMWRVLGAGIGGRGWGCSRRCITAMR